MQLRDTKNSYGAVSRALHWGMGIVIVGMLCGGFIMASGASGAEWRPIIYMVHSNIGLTIFLLASLRIVWRLFNPMPTLDSRTPAWQRIAARANVGLLYLFMIGFPLSGALMVHFSGRDIVYLGFLTLGGAPSPDAHIARICAGTHEFFGYAILVSLALHVTVALYHHFVLRDNVLRRMLTSR